MTKYTYKCGDCGCKFDVEATLKEKEEKSSSKFSCPECKSANTKAKFSFSSLFSSEDVGGGCCGGGGGCGCGCDDDCKDDDCGCGSGSAGRGGCCS